jgi:CHASE1-domain containing sensor protein
VNRARLVLLPLLILSAALGVTWIVWDHERQATRNELLSQFNFSLGDAVSRVEQRMATYELMLRGVQGLFAATGRMNRDQFHDYVGALNLDANFSGIQAIGVIDWVPAANKDAHVAAMRELGLASYTIQPGGARDDYAPITQREPYIGRNRIRLGFDAWADPARHGEGARLRHADDFRQGPAVGGRRAGCAARFRHVLADLHPSPAAG